MWLRCILFFVLSFSSRCFHSLFTLRLRKGLLRSIDGMDDDNKRPIKF